MNLSHFVCPVGRSDFVFNDSFCNYFPEQCGPDRPYIKIPTSEFMVKFVFYLLVFVASFFGNIIVIVVVYLYRAKMQSSAYTYLLNLSIAGLIIATGCMWPYFMVSIAHEYPLGEAMCKIHPFLQLTSMVSSVLTLATISLDQFFAVAYPIHARFTSRLQPVWVIMGIWIISAAVSVPFLVHKEHIVYRFSDHSNKICTEAWPSIQIFDPQLLICLKHEPSKTTYYTFITAALFFFPVAIMVIAYSVIMLKVWSSNVPGYQPEHNHVLHAKSKSKHLVVFDYISLVPSMSNSTAPYVLLLLFTVSYTWQARIFLARKPERPLQQDAWRLFYLFNLFSIVKLVAAVLVGFLICWMPLQVLILYERYDSNRISEGQLPPWFSQFSYFAHFIAYANSAINPLIYCFLNGKFRQGFFYVLTCQHNNRRKRSFQEGGTEIALVRTGNDSRKSSRAVSFRFSNQSGSINYDDGHVPGSRRESLDLIQLKKKDSATTNYRH